MKTRYIVLPAVVLALIATAALPMFAQGDPWATVHMQLTFISKPPLVGRVGVPYVYTAQARSKDTTAVIRYSSDRPSPPGFGIDSISGVVKWTPASRGWYQISIVARSNKGEYGVQRFTVTVTAGNGIVQGKVTDTVGVGIPQVVIEVLQAGNVEPSFGGCYSFSTKTDNNGNYRISNIDPGVYKLHAVSPTPLYASQWYDGKASAYEANRITIADSPSVTIANFILRNGPIRLPHIAVAGTVKDTASSPLKGASVFFVRLGFALNTNSTVEDFRSMFDLEGSALDFRLDGYSAHVFRAVTDSLGRYSLKVIPDTYIAFARATGYAVEFYKEQSDFLSATRLLLNKDTSGINFTLSKLPPVPYGTIKGMVLDTVKGIGVRSRIVAKRDRWTVTDHYPVPRSYTVDTDSLGAYTLEKLLPGSYFVLALPMGNYAPAFYSTDTSSTGWRRATRIVINGNTVTGIDIYVRPISVAIRGFAGIAGKIRVTGGIASGAGGAMVYAHRNSEVAGYGIADAAGQYEIAGLAPGTYAVTADLPGYDLPSSKTATISYTAAGAPQFASVDLNLSATTDVSDASVTQPERFVLEQNYPNPFNPTTVIDYRLSVASDVKLAVYDLLGREVAVLVNGVQPPGSHTVRFDASSLSTGVYMYRLSAGTMTATMKMLLLK